MTKNVKPTISNLRSPLWWWAFVLVLFLAGTVRFGWLDAIPPGWRDDELIEANMDARIAVGWRPLYIAEAEGHEPLYHYLHAATLALFGSSRLSYRWLSAASGLLAVALTMALSRRLFGARVALWAGGAMAVGFWPLMYSRFGLRHIGVLPPLLLAFYVLWRGVDMGRRFTQIHADENQKISVHQRLSASKENGLWFTLAGITLAAGLYTYFAGRIAPLIVMVFATYLLLFHHRTFKTTWRGFLWAGVLAVLLFAPLGFYLVCHPLEARLAVVGQPLLELLHGDPRLVLQTASGTLGMFTSSGDPEWLYNVPSRPVFNLFGGVLLWMGVLLCLYRWRQPRYFFLVLWLGLGLLPAFVSIPPASLSHAILAMPAAYVLPILPLVEAYRWLATRQSLIANRLSQIFILHSPFSILRPLLFIVHCSLFIVLATNGFRDLRDYFVVWPRRDMVRFLYRADYRDAARYLDAHSEITDVAIGSTLLGPWDRLALELDIRREVSIRLFNPERALIWVSNVVSTPILLTSFPRPTPPIGDIVAANAVSSETLSLSLILYTLPPTSNLHLPIPNLQSPIARFANHLDLLNARWVDEGSIAPGREAVLLTTWRVATSLDLPPTPIVGTPPPPGVYAGSRLAVFTHLLAADGTFLAGDDGLWVDPLTLHTDDRFVQLHRLAFPSGAAGGPCTLEIGLYDPLTGERWAALDSEGQASDRVLLPAICQED
jgi:hypothetical protein